MNTIYFLDTNVLLDDFEEYYDKKFYISSVTLQELESIKTNKNKTDDVHYAARAATRWLADNPDKYQVVRYTFEVATFISNNAYEPDDSNDFIICACAAYVQHLNPDCKVIFITHDLSCRNIANKVLGLNVEWSENKGEKIYKGYKKVSGTTEYINDYMANIDLSEWYTNEYLIINNIDDNTTREMRFDGENFVSLKLPQSKIIKGKNALQRCALDILNNPNITVAAILGGYGSGKTALCTRMALMAVQDKGWQSRIIALREIVSEGASIGYLPGEKDLKILDFMLPFADQLEGGEFELESLKQRGILEANTPYFIKGRTYNESILIADEAEDLTEKQIRLIGTRVGQNSRIFYSGDYKQSVINPSQNNALIKMCKELRGNPKFACIYLKEDVRSETSKMFANLFVRE